MMKFSIFKMTLLLTLSAAAYAEDTTQKPDIIQFDVMQSVQPRVITDAQCNEAFRGKIVLPHDFRDYHSKNLDITNRKSHHQIVTGDLGLFEWTETVTIKVDGKEFVSSAFATALYIDRKHKFTSPIDNLTNGKTGLFNSYYCTGIMHKIN